MQLMCNSEVHVIENIHKIWAYNLYNVNPDYFIHYDENGRNRTET